jgi:cytochrome c oxidase subunit 2
MSTYGFRSDATFHYTTFCCGVLFALSLSIVLWALVARPKRSRFDRGDSRRSVTLALAVVLVAFCGLDGGLAYRANGELHQGYWAFPTEPAPLRVEVLAQQWGWNLRTAGADETFGTADDIVTFNELTVPTGRPIWFELRSKDVIHSFYLPNARVKQDVIPGTTTRVWFAANKTGDYEIACSQHCGPQHYRMHGVVHVVAPAEFTARAADASTHAIAADAALADDLRWGWAWES